VGSRALRLQNHRRRRLERELIPDEYILNTFYQKEWGEIEYIQSELAQFDDEIEEIINQLDIEPELDEEGKEKPLKVTYALEWLRNEIDSVSTLDKSEAERLSIVLEGLRKKSQAQKQKKSELGKLTTKLFGKTNKETATLQFQA
jgi:Txe/YoeB family toxin of Txe-Axe toxin-antitoxin module